MIERLKSVGIKTKMQTDTDHAMMVYEYIHLGRHLDVLRWQASNITIVFCGSVPFSKYHVRSVFKSCEFWPMHAMKKYYAPECKLE